jgi:hypothetical protein
LRAVRRGRRGGRESSRWRVLKLVLWTLERFEGVCVVKDKELKLDEIESSHTAWEGRVQRGEKWRGCR